MKRGDCKKSRRISQQHENKSKLVIRKSRYTYHESIKVRAFFEVEKVSCITVMPLYTAS